jgi:anti-sigma regulatory factor (Ser/Thr protein kinase)
MSKARRFHCQPESVAGARHFVRDLLSDQPREIVEAAELMTSELATNSVRHAHSDFELAIHLSRDEIRVEVSDHGQGQPIMRSPTPREQSGRGLQIVQELSEDWGIVPSPNGKLVWFSLLLRTHAGEYKSRSTASSEKVPEQNHQPEQRHEADLRSSHSRIAKLRQPRWSLRAHGKRAGSSKVAILGQPAERRRVPCKGVSPVLKFKRTYATAVIRSS